MKTKIKIKKKIIKNYEKKIKLEKIISLII